MSIGPSNPSSRLAVGMTSDRLATVSPAARAVHRAILAASPSPAAHRTEPPWPMSSRPAATWTRPARAVALRRTAAPAPYRRPNRAAG
jgi:hypothetical protein